MSDSRPALLFLAHRIPYPPDKGDKIRSYHLLAGLALRYRIFLGAYVDDPSDWRHRGALEALCEEVRLAYISRGRKLARMAYGALSGAPMTLACYDDAAMRRWVSRVCAERGIRRAFCFSGGVAPLLDETSGGDVARVVDFVDVDSSKWSDYAATRRWPTSAVFDRESRLLLAAERRLGAAADASVFVSEKEAALFNSLAPELVARTSFVNNGVDARYFAPDARGADPYADRDRTVVFTGAMNYWPNIDAVVCFCDEVLPGLRRLDSRWRFCIVGSNPDRLVRALSGRHGVHVTGRVDDVRPWLGHAVAAVAPMRVARGVQNKVLEAMAMAKSVVASPQALEGIDVSPGLHVAVAREPQEWIREIVALGAGTHVVDGLAARDFVVREHAWSRSVERLASLIERDASR